jgi:NitT/TauT family transport system permease protein
MAKTGFSARPAPAADASAAAGGPPLAKPRSFYQRNLRLIRAVTSVVVCLAVWECVGRYVVTNKLFFVPFSVVVAAFGEQWSTGALQVHILTSLAEFISGFLLAAVVGILIGLAMALSQSVRDYLDPWVSFLFATPMVALAPLFVLWFSTGMLSKVAVVFFVVLLPVVINAYAGIDGTEQHLIEAARSFGSSRAQIVAKVMLPSALPVIVVGVRVGLARGLVGVAVAEMFGSRAGLGFMILNAAQTFDMASLFLSVGILALAGVLMVELMKAAERRMAPWRSVKVIA